MTSSDSFSFDPETGQVRLLHPQGTQLLCRITPGGLTLWSKRGKREVTIPWAQLTPWVMGAWSLTPALETVVS